jgi:lipoprotein LprG
MTARDRSDAAATFATVAVALAALAFVVVVGVAFGVGGGDGRAEADQGPVPDTAPRADDAVADPAADPGELVVGAAEAMGGVRSVEFVLERGGAPIFIDEFDRIALDRLRGQFTVPARAQAELTVTVNDNLATRLGAVAFDDEVWISNPVTGDFETLPAGYDIDPSKFFDPENGWRPLLANLREVELVGIDDRGGQRYHVRGIAPAAQVREITVGLVRDQDVDLDLWIHPGSLLVTAAAFTTVIDGARSEWVLTLGRYGDTFTIRPPENVDEQAAG